MWRILCKNYEILDWIRLKTRVQNRIFSILEKRLDPGTIIEWIEEDPSLIANDLRGLMNFLFNFHEYNLFINLLA